MRVLEEIETSRKNLDEKIVELWIWTVFHITSFENFERIKKAGELRWQQSKRKWSYGNKNKYICFFDWRKDKAKPGNTIQDTLREGLTQFPHPDSDRIVVLYLDKSKYNILIETDRKQIVESYNCIPYIEVRLKEIDIKRISARIITSPRNIKEWSLKWLHKQNR